MRENSDVGASQKIEGECGHEMAMLDSSKRDWKQNDDDGCSRGD